MLAQPRLTPEMEKKNVRLMASESSSDEVATPGVPSAEALDALHRLNVNTDRQCKDECQGEMGVDPCENKYLARLRNDNTNPRGCVVREAGDKGNGAFATDPIPKGTPLGEYVGEAMLNKPTSEYGVQLGSTRVYVDGHLHGNWTRYVNHSCDPNCELRLIEYAEPDGAFVHALVLFTRREIPAGNELHFDYGNMWTQPRCRCNSPFCQDKEKSVTGGNDKDSSVGDRQGRQRGGSGPKPPPVRNNDDTWQTTKKGGEERIVPPPSRHAPRTRKDSNDAARDNDKRQAAQTRTRGAKMKWKEGAHKAGKSKALTNGTKCVMCPLTGNTPPTTKGEGTGCETPHFSRKTFALKK